MILLAPKTTRQRNSYPRCNDPAKRGSVCEAFEKKPLPLALTLLLRNGSVPVSDNRSIDWANCERVGQLGDPGKLKLMSRHGRFPDHAGSYSDNVIYHEVL